MQKEIQCWTLCMRLVGKTEKGSKIKVACFKNRDYKGVLL